TRSLTIRSTMRVTPASAAGRAPARCSPATTTVPAAGRAQTGPSAVCTATFRSWRSELTGSDVFVHYSAIEGGGYKSLREGQRVQFEVVMERGRERAANVTAI